MTKGSVYCGVVISLALAVGGANQSLGQVQTQVPPVVPGAKPVAVEHIKIHGKSLEGNLEGDAVDRDVTGGVVGLVVSDVDVGAVAAQQPGAPVDRDRRWVAAAQRERRNDGGIV